MLAVQQPPWYTGSDRCLWIKRLPLSRDVLFLLLLLVGGVSKMLQTWLASCSDKDSHTVSWALVVSPSITIFFRVFSHSNMGT